MKRKKSQFLPKKVKSNSHGTLAGAEAHFTKPDALIEPLSTSYFIPSSSQNASPFEVTCSKLSLKSPHQDKEKEEKVLPRKAIGNNHVTLPETETASNNPSNIP
ncbi:hypothetical protein DSO57_1000482 [Entomophthora muscae]|uniref:Uncharacterized protein n=1 Tax=Entomophthora muscae TaxID=34485 RepID=A0ACC2UW85_9FUNG|nr:hypothetical protein DSO57_1000482 [Entomophthora muscae]